MLDIYRTRLPSGGSVQWLHPVTGPIFISELGLALDQIQVNWVEFEVASGVLTRIKYWNGSAWVGITALKHWNGSAFVAGTLKQWNGSAWVS